MDLKVRRGEKDRENGNNIEGNKKEEVKADKTTLSLLLLLLGKSQCHQKNVESQETDLTDEKSEWIIWKVSPCGHRDQQQVLRCVQRHQEPELGLLLAPVDPLQGEEGEGEPEGGENFGELRTLLTATMRKWTKINRSTRLSCYQRRQKLRSEAAVGWSLPGIPKYCPLLAI